MDQEILINTLSIFLPKGVLQWFDVKRTCGTETQIQIFLEEKNIPPLTEKHAGKKVWSKGFTKISVDDFPARGKKVILVFKRRYWEVEGEKEYLKRNIEITAKGTKLEKEFANFLKEASQYYAN